MDYFPCTELLPFLKAVDVATKSQVNDIKFNKLGSSMLTTIVESLHSDANLFAMFSTALTARMCDLPIVTVNGIFKEMVQKLSYIRVQEYLDAFKQKELLKRGVLH